MDSPLHLQIKYSFMHPASIHRHMDMVCVILMLLHSSIQSISAHAHNLHMVCSDKVASAWGQSFDARGRRLHLQ